MKNLSLSILAAAVVCACGPVTAGAQSFQGSVRGVVRDADGAVPAATVTLVEESTGFARTASANEQGHFAVLDVAPGIYQLSVSAPGYREYRQPGMRVGTGHVVTADVALQPGGFSQAITVYGELPAVETSNASIGTLIDRRTLDRLPSAGRNVFFTATLAPAVVPSGDSQFVRQQDQSNSSLIAIGGGPRRDNSYVLDGVPIVDILNRATFIPSFEAVEEIRVQQSAYDAEIGRTSGGVFNTVGRTGSNIWRAGALYQNRPAWAQGQLFFARKTGAPESATYYHLYGGSSGGPIVRGRTFFFAGTEGYRSATTRSTVLVLPTAAERLGDFSASGVTIYDPLTTRSDPRDSSRFVRDPFPSNRIPQDRLNPVALALLRYLPLPTSGNSRPATADIVDRADQVTTKVTHRWNDAVSTSGLYAWYASQEPDARFYGGGLFENGADPGDGALVRRVHLLALNNTWVHGDGSVVDFRVGMNRFLDDNRPAPFDPSGLGFAPAFLDAVGPRKFPGIGVADYGRGGALLGDRTQGRASYYSQQVSLTLSKLLGRHMLKVGGEYRETGVAFVNFGGLGGYTFNRDFTLGPDPNQPATATGSGFAAFLLGYPSAGSIGASSPIDIYLRYGGAFLQDDFRVTPRLTISLGLRYEFETGLREHDDRLVVGWAGDSRFPVQVGGTRPDGSPLVLTGGLIYAGIDGAARHQGTPGPTQFAPRAGLAYLLTDRMVVRGGYGLFWAPVQGISADEFGSSTHGYNRSTTYVPTEGNPFVPCATCSLTNPFPRGIDQPVGNTLGRLMGVGGTISFVDPQSRMGRMHRYSIEMQREVMGRIVFRAGYLGARGADLAGGLSGAPLSINQLDRRHQALGTGLQEPVANPFFGSPLGVGILAGPTVPRGQLLRPYPQFDTVYVMRSNISRSRYDALVAGVDRRLGNRWSARANYTWSRLRDNQFSESNFFAGGSAILDNNDTDAEYGLSVLDAPHRLNVMAHAELPFGLAVSVAGTYQSGFPVTVQQSPNNSHLIGSTQRPNVVPGAAPLLTGNPADSYDPACACIRWLNPAAWSQAAPFTFGDAPRADGRARTPVRQNWDVAVQKAHRIGASVVSVTCEVINVFDVADFRGPNIVFGDAGFGQIREAAGFPRMLQVSTRIAW